MITLVAASLNSSTCQATRRRNNKKEKKLGRRENKARYTCVRLGRKCVYDAVLRDTAAQLIKP